MWVYLLHIICYFGSIVSSRKYPFVFVYCGDLHGVIFVRFNLVALRNDKTDRLFVVNNGAVLVLFVSVAYFIRVFMGGFPTWLDITIGAVAGVYAIVIIIFYVLNARKGNLRRL